MSNIFEHSASNYEALVAGLIAQYPRDIAMARAIGTVEEYVKTGDGQLAVLKFHGLQDGMSIYDLGCGSGRTAQALFRSGWKGQYRGADVLGHSSNI